MHRPLAILASSPHDVRGCRRRRRTAAPARASDTELRLVAYSTPREAYAQLIPMFQKTAAGKDVSFSQSYGASGEQARAVKAGLKADLVALSLAPDVDELVKAGLVFKGWKKKPYKGMVTNSARRLRPPRRQPEEDQDVDRPPQARGRGRDAEPVHVRRRALEHHGRVRRVAPRGQDRQAGAGEPAQALQERRRPGQERARLAEHVHERQGRRPPRLRERGAVLEAEGARRPVRHPALDDPHREPDRGHEDDRALEGGERVPEVPHDAGRAAGVREQRLPAGREEACSRGTGRSSPSAPASSRSTRSRSAAGRRRRSASSIPRPGSW